ncbi:serine arginine repetitive matrix protein 1 [Colletotrichum tofieldiae]|nr:serine arginine repetitive matrix protein 1 [Colletotrichum tofieldiae]
MTTTNREAPKPAAAAAAAAVAAPKNRPHRGGGYSARGGRGSWSGPPPRQAPAPTTSPSATGNGPSTIPTGPRANPANNTPSNPSTAPKAFNPPTGPSSQHGAGGARPTLAQSMLATLPPIIPGGKIDPSLLPTTTGITRDIEPHYKKLKAEEEKARAELDAKQDKLRQSLQMWDKLEMESKAWKTRVDLSEQSLKSLAGEGLGGAAF